MTVEDPGTLLVSCDRCDKSEEMDTTEYCGEPPSWGVDDTTLEENGWGIVDGEYLCPDCLKHEEG